MNLYTPIIIIESFLCPSGKRSCIFSKLNLLNVDTPLTWTFLKTPSVSRFIGFKCSNDLLFFNAQPSRASDISRGRGPAKFRYFREIPRNSQKNAKYCEIRQKYFQIHVGKTYLILILLSLIHI